MYVFVMPLVTLKLVKNLINIVSALAYHILLIHLAIKQIIYIQLVAQFRITFTSRRIPNSCSE